MRFIKEHKLLSLVSSVFIILLVIMVVSYKNGGSNGAPTKKIQEAVNTLQAPVSFTKDTIKANVSSLVKYRALKAENEALKEKVHELEQEIIDSEIEKNELKELKKLSEVLNYEAVQRSAGLVSASIVALDESNRLRVFTIDRGTDSGIRKDCMVVNGEGLVGRVLEVGENWSKVISVIDESNNVSFMVQRDMGIIGIVSGNGKGKLSGFTIDNNASIIKGDTLITSNIGIYPAGIRIGKVSKVKYDNDTQIKSVTVEPGVSFNSLQKVAVIL